MAGLDNETKKKLKMSLDGTKGRPGIVENNDALLEAIAEIAISGLAADEKRRSTMVRSVKTLDDLTEALQQQGYNLSRSAVYLHLKPRD